MKKVLVIVAVALALSSCASVGSYVQTSLSRNLGIAVSNVYVGMPEKEMRAALPVGYSVNTDITSSGAVKKQYVTKGMNYFIYVENGVVVYIQKRSAY